MNFIWSKEQKYLRGIFLTPHTPKSILPKREKRAFLMVLELESPNKSKEKERILKKSKVVPNLLV
jgi:hypothetical protein